MGYDKREAMAKNNGIAIIVWVAGTVSGTQRVCQERIDRSQTKGSFAGYQSL